jgi:16S rRNA (guanine1516-N2)-methyltransferase
VGIRGDPPTVLDATTGLARDAFLLACLGCTVIAVERSAVLGRLIQDGLERARNSGLSELVEVLGRMKFIVDDSRNVLRRWRGEKPDVVYIDPMYPLEAKRSLAKKEMQICRLLVGDDTDSAELLAVARQTARKRVVVKRPRHAPPLAAEPDVQYLSKLVGYDVQYLSKLVRYDVFLTSGNGTKA